METKMKGTWDPDSAEALIRHLENSPLWTVVTFRVNSGPSDIMEGMEEVLRKAGWRVTFRANWWAADVPYGVVRFDLKKGDVEKILLGEWIIGDDFEVIGFEDLELEEGKEEFFRVVDKITSTLIHDPVIRTMRGQY